MNDNHIEQFEGLTIWWQPEGHYVTFQVYTDENGDELYLTGHVKWDGCTEFHAASDHFCGGQALGAHILLLQHLYTEAFTYMASCQVDDPIPLTIVRT